MAVSQGAQIILSDLWQDYFFAVWLSLPYGSIRRLVGKHCRGGSAYCRSIPVTLDARLLCCVLSEVPDWGVLKEAFFIVAWSFSELEGRERK